MISICRSPDSSGRKHSGCGAAWLARMVWDHEVGGSNPPTPISATKGTSWPEAAQICSLQNLLTFILKRSHNELGSPVAQR